VYSAGKFRKLGEFMNFRLARHCTMLLSGAVWLATGLFVAMSGLIYPGGIILNLVMASAFTGLGAVLLGRAAFSPSGHAAARQSWYYISWSRIEPWVVGFSLIFGSFLLFAAGYRFFAEQKAVFG